MNKRKKIVESYKMQVCSKRMRMPGAKNYHHGVTPLMRKTIPIESLKPSRTLSLLKSCISFIHSLHKYLPNLTESSAPLQPLLSKNRGYVWKAECQAVFGNSKKQVAKIVQLRHFDIHNDIRIVSDASHNNLGAVLDHLGPVGWR